MMTRMLLLRRQQLVWGGMRFQWPPMVRFRCMVVVPVRCSTHQLLRRLALLIGWLMMGNCC